MLAAALAALTLTACAGNDDVAARMLVAPGKFALFNCKQLAQQAEDNAKRQQELEGLMARAGAGTGGQLISAVTYRPEYLTLRGEMEDMRQTAVDKKCDFVPGANTAPRDAAIGAIH
jgi:hypothetical protein